MPFELPRFDRCPGDCDQHDLNKASWEWLRIGADDVHAPFHRLYRPIGRVEANRQTSLNLVEEGGRAIIDANVWPGTVRQILRSDFHHTGLPVSDRQDVSRFTYRDRRHRGGRLIYKDGEAIAKMVNSCEYLINA